VLKEIPIYVNPLDTALMESTLYGVVTSTSEEIDEKLTTSCILEIEKYIQNSENLEHHEIKWKPHNEST